jgi:hypothetical protein
MNTPTNLAPVKPKSLHEKLFRVIFGVLVVFALCEIVVISTIYIHEPLAWAFLLQAAAMFIGGLSGLIIGKLQNKKRKT